MPFINMKFERWILSTTLIDHDTDAMEIKFSPSSNFKELLVNTLQPWVQKAAKLLPLMKREQAAEVSNRSVVSLACDFGRSKILMLQIQKSADGLKVMRFQNIIRPEGKSEVVDVLKQCFEAGQFETRRVRVSLKGQGVIARFIQFPQMKPQDLRSALSFEVEKYIPFKSDEVIIDYHIVDDGLGGGTAKQMSLLLVAVKRDEVMSLVQAFQTAGLEVEFIDIDSVAIINALEYFHPEDFNSSTAILDIGAEVSNLSVVQQGKPRFIRDISYGGADIVKRLKRKLGFTEQQARAQLQETDKMPAADVTVILQEVLGNLTSDLKVSLDYYLDQIPHAEPVKKIFLGGGEAYHPVVLETLKRDLKLPVQPMCILEKVELSPEIDQSLFMKSLGFLPVPFGLCLRNR